MEHSAYNVGFIPTFASKDSVCKPVSIFAKCLNSVDQQCIGSLLSLWLVLLTHCALLLQVSDPKVEASEASFMKLIETLLEQPEERELFFQVSVITCWGKVT